MLAKIYATEAGYEARFERNFKHSAEEVWTYLTQNDKLQLWFPELSVTELQAGSHILFHMGNDNHERMKILHVLPNQLLEYTWDKDVVRFELLPVSNGCELIFTEKLTSITDHTPRDLAGWHVCLDVIALLLDNKPVYDRSIQWKLWYEQYKEQLSYIIK